MHKHSICLECFLSRQSSPNFSHSVLHEEREVIWEWRPLLAMGGDKCLSFPFPAGAHVHGQNRNAIFKTAIRQQFCYCLAVVRSSSPLSLIDSWRNSFIMASQALRCHIDLSLRWLPDPSWKGSAWKPQATASNIITTASNRRQGFVYGKQFSEYCNQGFIYRKQVYDYKV